MIAVFPLRRGQIWIMGDISSTPSSGQVPISLLNCLITLPMTMQRHYLLRLIPHKSHYTIRMVLDFLIPSRTRPSEKGRAFSSPAEALTLVWQVIPHSSPKKANLHPLALQFLKLSGFENIITTASKSHEKLVKSYGATHLIDRSLPLSAQVEQIKAIAPKLQYVWDCIGSKDTNTLAAQSFGSEGGLIVSSLPVSKEVLAEYKNVQGRDIFSGPSAHPDSAARVWGRMTQALEGGEIRPLPYRVHEGGLAKITEALGAVKKASGYKVVIHPQE